MDWFNTAYWSFHTGAYDVWRTIYPPLSFVFLKVFSVGSCYARDPFMARSCDIVGRTSLVAIYALNMVIVGMSYWRSDRRTALPRTGALMLGLPMLCALERGNLILPAFAFFALSCGGVAKSPRWRWLAAAVAINFKPYLLVMLAPQVVWGQWKRLETVIVVGASVYFISYVLFASGAPGEILRNQLIWAQGGGRTYFEAFYSASAYGSALDYIQHAEAIRRPFADPWFGLIEGFTRLSVHLGQIGVLAALAGAGLSRSTTQDHRVGALAISLVLTTMDVGVYADVFLIFLVFLERWRGPASAVALIAAYLLSLSVDVALQHLGSRAGYSYLTSRMVTADVSLNIGSILRPGLLLVIQYALVAATLGDIWQARAPARLDDAPGAMGPASWRGLARRFTNWGARKVDNEA